MKRFTCHALIALLCVLGTSQAGAMDLPPLTKNKREKHKEKPEKAQAKATAKELEVEVRLDWMHETFEGNDTVVRHRERKLALPFLTPSDVEGQCPDAFQHPLWKNRFDMPHDSPHLKKLVELNAKKDPLGAQHVIPAFANYLATAMAFERACKKGTATLVQTTAYIQAHDELSTSRIDGDKLVKQADRLLARLARRSCSSSSSSAE